MKKYSRTAVKDEICTMADLNLIINLPKKKRLKTQNKEKGHEGNEIKVEDEIEKEEKGGKGNPT